MARASWEGQAGAPAKLCRREVTDCTQGNRKGEGGEQTDKISQERHPGSHQSTPDTAKKAPVPDEQKNESCPREQFCLEGGEEAK